MTRLILLIAIGTAGYLIYKLYFKQLLSQGNTGKLKIGLIVVGLIFLALAATGRANILFGVIGALMTQIMRIAPLIVRFAPFLTKYLSPSILGTPPFNSSQSTSNQSKVSTPSLDMTLDHESGRIDGQILSGELRGKLLSELSEAELREFYQYCLQHDAEAARLLDAFISRERSNWHSSEESTSQSTGDDTGSVSVREAYDILGLASGATRQEIKNAHRELMSQLHPDKGGSNYLAAKVNEAKKMLLAHIGKD